MPWAQSGEIFSKTYPNPIDLPPFVYSVECSPISGFYLKKIADSFDLPAKTYEVQPGLVKRIVQSHKNLNRSMGVLLSGLKGAGKSVTAKQVCNLSGLPTLVVTDAYDGIEDFLASLDTPVVVFLDEYEKVFTSNQQNNNNDVHAVLRARNNTAIENGSSKLLSLMDGATVAPAHLYVLTVNQKFVSTNMLDRPSRIRYLVEFSDLPQQIIEEIVDDNLEDVSVRAQVIDWLSYREVLSIDGLIAALNEINWFGFDAGRMDGWFNLAARQPDNYTIYKNNLPFASVSNPHGQYFRPFGNLAKQGTNYVTFEYNETSGNAYCIEFGNSVYDDDMNEIENSSPLTVPEKYQAVASRASSSYHNITDIYPIRIEKDKIVHSSFAF